MIFFLVLFYFFNFLLTNSVDFNFSKKKQIDNEIGSLNKNKLAFGHSIFPFTHSAYLDTTKLSLVKNNPNIFLRPILSLRHSSSGFEIFKRYSSSSVLWITPGLEMNFVKPIAFGFFDLGINLQGWLKFHKHSAYGFNDEVPDLNQVMFQFHPDHSFEFYSNSKQPSNGIDFDEGEGALSLNSRSTNIIFGKFKTNIGPFHSGNLSISYSAPAFPQVQLRTKNEKINFSFIVGELQSNMSLNSNDSEIIRKRFIVNHRIDFMIRENFKVGFYEQVFTGDNLSLSYLIPIIPYWSVQHANGDKDNLQMGFDLEFISNKNKYTFALIVDEWAPFDTFRRNHHNWFGGQIGFSRLISKKGIFMFEYTRLQPQVYIHDIAINQAFNGNYPIGFWSNGDSEELYFKFAYFFYDNFNLNVSLRNTNLGNPQYGLNVDFLGGDIKNRTALEIEMIKKIYTKIGPLNYLFKINHIKTTNIYEDGNFNDYQISLLYNINY